MEEGGGGGKLAEGVEVAAGLGLVWAFEQPPEPPSLKKIQKQFKQIPTILVFLLRLFCSSP